MGLGKIFHYSVDLILVSMVLAGVHRSTGLVFDTNELSSVDIRRWIGKYLAFGERVYDYLVSALRHSGYFTQRSVAMDYLAREANKIIKKNLQDGEN